MVKRLSVGLALQPVATGLVANSAFAGGRPSGVLARRSEIWRDTGRDRTGMFPQAFEDGFGYEGYVDWLLDMPMYFVKRGDTYHDVSGASFRDLMADGCRNCRASTPRSRTGRTTPRRRSRRFGSSSSWRCGGPTSAART